MSNLTQGKNVHMNAPTTGSGGVDVRLGRAATERTADQALWAVIRRSTNLLSFNNYAAFIDKYMCNPKELDNKPCIDPSDHKTLAAKRFLPFPDMDGYRVLKVATECFLMAHCGVRSDFFRNMSADEESGRFNRDVTVADIETLWWNQYLVDIHGEKKKHEGETGEGEARNPDDTLPYLELIRARLGDLTVSSKDDSAMGVKCYHILRRKLTNPCFLELIWSYWHEEGMLVQTLNAVSRRFQNISGPGARDPLARFDIDPLRGLNNLLWGYIQDEQHRLTVRRRAYEYTHHYGLTLEGKAVPQLRPSDSRSKFLEGFHNLLYLCAIFYKEDDDTTVIADGFPVLNALKEVHYLLAEGAHNQFGDLPSTARQEMLIQQWLLARPEMREFLGAKVMVAFPEVWMDRVDAVKNMQGWTDVSVMHFRDLGVYGEQIILSIRYAAWSITNDPAQAANWARYWRPEIQAYIHAYRAATGVDLTTEPVNVTKPSVLLRNRLATRGPAGR